MSNAASNPCWPEFIDWLASQVQVNEVILNKGTRRSKLAGIEPKVIKEVIIAVHPTKMAQLAAWFRVEVRPGMDAAAIAQLLWEKNYRYTNVTGGKYIYAVTQEDFPCEPGPSRRSEQQYNPGHEFMDQLERSMRDGW